MGQAVTQEIDVVTLLEAVQTLVRAAGFGAGQARMRHRLRYLELEAEFDRRDPIGVPGARLVFQRDAGIALAQLLKLVAGLLHLRSESVDAAALFHAGAHLGPQAGVMLAPALL